MSEEYRGRLSHCFHCKKKFHENDTVAVAPLGMIFCLPIFANDKDCIEVWRRARHITAIDFKIKIFKGVKPSDDGHNIEMV